MNQTELDNLQWHAVDGNLIRGQGWKDEYRLSPFHRLPETLKAEIPPKLWELGCQCAGQYIEFSSNSSNIYARWELNSFEKRFPYMARLGISGLDLYGRDGSGSWKWVGTVNGWDEEHPCDQFNDEPLDGSTREFRIYLPFMGEIKKLEVGTEGDLIFSDASQRKPIAYYGTSIVHGAGVSRSGLSHASQLGRSLERELINLGFSGHALCEIPIATAMGRLDPSLYIVDVLPNNGAKQLKDRLPRFLRLIREARPKTPILLLGDRVFPDSSFLPERGIVYHRKNSQLELIYQELKDERFPKLHLYLHPDWFGPEGSSDGSHPNDLGATRMAEALVPIVRSIIG